MTVWSLHSAARYAFIPTEGPVTLIYAARDQEHNEAVILQKLLKSK